MFLTLSLNLKFCSMEKCIECGCKLVGRSDKKFCDSNCRNAYHNEKSRPIINQVRKINRSLATNRSILENLALEGVDQVALKILRTLGFNENLITARYKDEKGEEILCIYDQVFRLNLDEIVILTEGTGNFRPTG